MPVNPFLALVNTPPSDSVAAAIPLAGAAQSGNDWLIPPPAPQATEPMAGEIAESAETDSDPQVMLDLLLAAQPVTVPAEPPVAGTIAGGSVRMVSLPDAAAPRVSSPDQSLLAESPADGGRATARSAPLKLAQPVDALLASKIVQRELQVTREAGIASPTLQHPAVSLVNTLLGREISPGKLPAITLPAAPQQQAEALQKALAERLNLQVSQRTQQATIRLDPPNLGKLDISLHYEAGKLQVQIQAAQPEVTRLLQQVSADLRTSLSEHNNVQVNVQVSTQSGGSRQQQQHRGEPETAIAINYEEVATQARGTDDTILTMV